MYQRPLIIRLPDLAEGIYAFSGDVYEEQLEQFVSENSDTPSQNSGAGASYRLAQTNAWDGNRQYDFFFTNNSDQKVDSLTVTVSCNGTVTSIGGNVSGNVNGDTADITFNNFGNGIEGGATVGPIYVLVTGQGDFGIQ